MTRVKIGILNIALAASAGFAGLLASETGSLTRPGTLVTSAHAIIGRPLTPMSYAGVARRTTVGVGVGVGMAVGAAAVAPACAQVVNAYGQITTVCR
jgi:hypothetical protein